MKKILTVLFLIPLFAFSQNVKISELPSATSVSGTEHIPIVQSSTTKKIRVDTLFSYQNVKTVKVTVSSADIKTFNTPFPVIDAPGVGKFIDVLAVKFNLRDGTVAYDTNTNLQMFLGTPSTVAVTNSISTFLAATSAFAKPAMPVLTAVNTTKSNYENQALNLYTSGGNPATGDGVLDVYITYQIVNL